MADLCLKEPGLSAAKMMPLEPLVIEPLNPESILDRLRAVDIIDHIGVSKSVLGQALQGAELRKLVGASAGCQRTRILPKCTILWPLYIAR